MKPYERISIAAVILGIMVLGYICYRPGLNGGFLFDDFANLPALGATGPVTNWPAAARYLTSGTADPFGRPVALLSFLIDARNWPAPPYPFLRTNIFIHLINGTLLAYLLKELMRSLALNAAGHRIQNAQWVAVVGSALWTLHPLFVSTTLYIVQREAMLAGTFTYLGLVFWIKGRCAFGNNQTQKGLIFFVAGFLPCIALAMLSKANGILLPALALLVECTYPSPFSGNLHKKGPETKALARHGLPTPRAVYKIILGVACIAPTFLIIAYLTYRGWDGLVHGLRFPRPWTMGQRLLTEPRVLVDYLQSLWLPRLYTHGLFNDQMKSSTSLWAPATTLPSIILIVGLIGVAWRGRRKHPVLALSVLFYFVAQGLESTTLPLELYFEHRNYVSAALMFWPLSIWLMQPASHKQAALGTTNSWPRKGERSDETNAPRAKIALSVVIIGGLALMTFLRASSWSDIGTQAIHWAEFNPYSPRAQANAAQAEMNAGNFLHAQVRLKQALLGSPDEAQLALNLFAAECHMGHVSNVTLSQTKRALRTMRDPGTLLVSWFERSIDAASQPECPEDSISELHDLLGAAAQNAPLMAQPGRRQDIYYLRGRLYLSEKRADDALGQFNLAIDQQVRIELALQQSALLGAAGFAPQGLAHLEHYQLESGNAARPDPGMPRIHEWVLQRQHYWQKELIYLHKTLTDDAQASQNQHGHQ